jgi:PAS domain S-box-containing protein
MTQSASRLNFADCLTVSQAAEYLGVSTATLRNWDRLGKLKTRRHPQNGYRIYLHEDLAALLRTAELPNLSDDAAAPRIDWRAMGDREHFVQFYESDAFLIQCVSEFVGAALNQNDASIVIATPDHRIALQRKLVSQGISVAAAIEAGRYVVLDAQDTLGKFTSDDGSLDGRRFNEHIGGLISQLAHGGRRVHAFGEMVALLWDQGERHAAIRLEELWNELGKSHRFALFCAYPIQGFGDESDSVPFNGICSCHSRVVPAESYADIESADERLRAISLLQQKAQSLGAEIDHRIEVQRTLSLRERELDDFFENASEGLKKVAPNGTILWANQSELDLLGYAVEEYVGHSVAEFQVDEAQVFELMNRVRRGEPLKNVAARLRAKDGSIKHVLLSSNACFDDGELLYCRFFTRDVTQQWHAEEALREADRRKDQFLAMLAHELRNPLAPIRHGLEVLRLGGRDETIAGEARQVMERQVEQMTRLVDDLLDVSRITRDKLELRKQHVELVAVVQRAIETSRPLIESGGHELAVSLPELPILLNADPMRMAQVFSNLLNNSAKYTDLGGRIEIGARLDERQVVVVVRDNGVGIACEALAHVFDMFHQADRSLDKAQGGLGIGLTLVRRLVELHGGTINAQSEGIGKGSEFIVRLPIEPAGSNQPHHPAFAKPLQVGKQRILVVDDNKDSGDTLALVLKAKGHEVRTARDGLQAIEIAPEFLPQVILMDIGMPNLNGYETTRRIREMDCGRDAKIVALTGWSQAEDLAQSKEAGCTAHLVKPVDFAALDRLLASWPESAASWVR